jgi:hypothetical protein
MKASVLICKLFASLIWGLVLVFGIFAVIIISFATFFAAGLTSFFVKNI